MLEKQNQKKFRTECNQINERVIHMFSASMKSIYWLMHIAYIETCFLYLHVSSLL